MHHMQEREASIKQETADLKLLIEANTALTEDRTTDGEGEAERGELGVTSDVVFGKGLLDQQQAELVEAR